MTETYEENEIVLCKDYETDNFGYVSKILSVGADEETGLPIYRVHYMKWSDKWDTWASPSDLWKYTPERAEEHKLLLKAKEEVQKKNNKRKSTSKKDTATPKKATPKKNIASTPKARAVSVVAPTPRAKSVAGGTPRAKSVAGRTPRAKSVAGGTPRAKSVAGGTPRAKSVAGGTPRAKSIGGRKRQAEEEKEPETLTVKMPMALRALLAMDKSLVKEQGRLASIPAAYTIDHLAAEYGKMKTHMTPRVITPEHCGLNEGHQREYRDMLEVTKTIVECFNIICGKTLLYATEKDQFEKACVNPEEEAEGRRVDETKQPELKGIKIIPSSVYGLPHLVRLFIRIGDVLPLEKFSDAKIIRIAVEIEAFLDFLVSKSQAVDMETHYDKANKEKMDETVDGTEMNEKNNDKADEEEKMDELVDEKLDENAKEEKMDETGDGTEMNVKHNGKADEAEEMDEMTDEKLDEKAEEMPIPRVSSISRMM